MNAHWAMDGSQRGPFILVPINWPWTSDYRPDFYILKSKMGMLPTAFPLKYLTESDTLNTKRVSWDEFNPDANDQGKGSVPQNESHSRYWSPGPGHRQSLATVLLTEWLYIQGFP